MLNPAMAADERMNGFTQVISHEKNERIARASLHDIEVFQESLEKEIKKLDADAAKGIAIDVELMEKMTIVSDHYKKVLGGFGVDDIATQRHTLMIYGDAVQDLITHLHRRS